MSSDNKDETLSGDGQAPGRPSMDTSITSTNTVRIDFDSLLPILGGFGRYQCFLFVLVSFMSFPGAFNNLGIVFLAAEPPFHCVAPSAEHLHLTPDELLLLTAPPTGRQEDCSRQCTQYNTNYSSWTRAEVAEVVAHGRNVTDTGPCQHGWVYNTSTYTSTIVTQWDLVCEQQALVPTAASVFMAGLLVGVFGFGAISDWFGRKAAIIPATIGMIVFSVAHSFSPNYTTFVSLRFLIGACSIGSFTTTYVLSMEMVGPSWRTFAGVLPMYPWVAGYMVVAGLAYAIRDWRHLAIALSVPQALLIIVIFLLPESPRWLYSRNKHERGDAVVRRIAKWNKVDLPSNINIQLQKGPQQYVFDLFRFPRLRWRTLNICFNWFVNSLVYYGLSLNTGQLGGNDYVNFMLSGLVELPAYIFCQVGLKYVGRRKTLVATMVTAGLALLVILAVPKAEHLCGVSMNSVKPELHNLRIALAMIGKLCISASFAVIYVFSTELFPTVVRSVGVGLGSTCARVGGIMAPYILSVRSDAPYIVFGLMAVVAGLLAFLLPETNNQQLPETIEDGENFPRKVDKEDQDTQDGGLPPDLSVETAPVETAYLGMGLGVQNTGYSFESNI